MALPPAAIADVQSLCKQAEECVDLLDEVCPF